LRFSLVLIWRTRRSRRVQRVLLGVVWIARSAFAQSVSIDSEPAQDNSPVTPPPTPAPTPAPVPAAEPVIPPRAISTPINYPTQARGAREVVLELTIDKQGRILWREVSENRGNVDAIPSVDAALKSIPGS